MVRRRTVWLGTFGVMAIAACSSDRAYAPPGTTLTDAQVSRDVAVSAGNAAASELQDQNDYVADAGITASRDNAPPPSGPATASPAQSAPACTYAAATGRWNCAPFVNQRGLTVTRSYAYFDAANVPMEHYDRLRTAKINYQHETHGPVGDGVTFYGTTHQRGNETASGLIGAETVRTWDGVTVSADTNTHKDAAGTRQYAGVRIDSMIAVTWAQPRAPGAFPLSGRMVQAANYMVTSTGSQTETRSVSRRSVVTYNGTADATLQIGAVSCTLHLDTRKVDSCH